MNPFDEMATKIVKEQELIIGPLAWQEASKVPGLRIEPSHASIAVSEGNGTTIDKLVGQYEHLFGRASREVCREAVASILKGLPAAQIPSSLAA